jgi:hypothetical protein
MLLNRSSVWSFPFRMCIPPHVLKLFPIAILVHGILRPIGRHTPGVHTLPGEFTNITMGGIEQLVRSAKQLEVFDILLNS